MNRWTVLPILVALALAGCTGNNDGDDTDPTPTPAGTTPAASPTRTTPAATPTASPTSSTPASTPPTATTPPTTSTPPAATNKAFEFTMSLTAGEASNPGLPVPVGEAPTNCAGFSAVTILGGNATATYEDPAVPVGGPGDVELIVLGPDGAVLVRAAGPSPVTVTIPAVAIAGTGIKLVVQHAEAPATPSSTDVSIAGALLLPPGTADPTQDAPTTCERVA